MFRVAKFSSRGPTTDMKLSPDVVAPGVNVLAAGYGEGRDPRVSFGLSSGTSMATPFVSGAAAVILQEHPEFTTEEVKSALMTTADFINVTRQEDGEPAQPLDMGAGRINLERAINPPLYISPPKVDFSLAQKPEEYTRTVNVHSYSDEEFTVAVNIVYHTGYNEVTPAGDYLSAEPSEFTLNAENKDVSVTFSLNTSSAGLWDENAYVLFVDKSTGDELAHIPLWGQITCAEDEKKDVLLAVIDPYYCNESKNESVVDVYIKALNETGLSYDFYDFCRPDESDLLLEKAFGLGYRAVILAVSRNAPLYMFSDMESEVRRAMHAGVTVIQMGRNLDYMWSDHIWDYTSIALENEFGIDLSRTYFDACVVSESEYLVANTSVPEYVKFSVTGHNTLYKTNTGKPFVVSAKDSNFGYDELKTVNSIGITSFVGLEEFKEQYRKGKKEEKNVSCVHYFDLIYVYFFHRCYFENVLAWNRKEE